MSLTQENHCFWIPHIFLITSIVVTFIPLPSIQHFVWPLDQCLLSDICNHTWFPECGKDNLSTEFRLFLDMCDMYEYNCDFFREFEPANLSDCYKAHTGCPVVKCPSYPPCKNHNLHRMGAHYLTVTIPARRTFSIPKHWVNGKRRYTRRGKIKSKPSKKTTEPHSRLRTFRRRGGTKSMQPTLASTVKKPGCGGCNRQQEKHANMMKKKKVVRTGRPLAAKGRPPFRTRALLASISLVTKARTLTSIVQTLPPPIPKAIFQSTTTGIPSSLRSPATSMQSGVIIQPSKNNVQSRIDFKRTTVTSLSPFLRTVIFRKETVWKDGKRFYRVVKGVEIIKQPTVNVDRNESSGYLE